jgi:ATP-dependent Zn protease
LKQNEGEIKLIAQRLFEYDCLTGKDIIQIFAGKKLEKAKIREIST